jgi:hypothetical protein
LLSFSGRGPDAGGTRPLDLVSNGMAGTGAAPLTAYGDGRQAYVHWYGTSRSAPMTAGIAALVYQAFYQQHGRYPTWQEARTLLRSGAEDAHNDPLAQGAGLPNAFRSVQAAVGEYGVVISPSVLTAGDWRGQTCPGCGSGLLPGEVFPLSITVANPGGVPLEVHLGAQTLREGLTGPMAQKSLALMAPTERERLEAFRDGGDLPNPLDKPFLRALAHALGGLERVTVSPEEILLALTKNSKAPCTVEEIRSRFDQLMTQLTQGKDPQRIRIVIEW